MDYQWKVGTGRQESPGKSECSRESRTRDQERAEKPWGFWWALSKGIEWWKGSSKRETKPPKADKNWGQVRTEKGRSLYWRMGTGQETGKG